MRLLLASILVLTACTSAVSTPSCPEPSGTLTETWDRLEGTCEPSLSASYAVRSYAADLPARECKGTRQRVSQCVWRVSYDCPFDVAPSSMSAEGEVTWDMTGTRASGTVDVAMSDGKGGACSARYSVAVTRQ